jgi:hypothetical protein
MADTFCDNNTKPVQIDVSIPGGTFQIDGKEAKTFIPATAGAGKHTIIYTVKNVPSLPKTVTVLSTPQHIDFVAAVIQDGNNFDVKFTPSIVTTDFNYEWRFDAQFKDHGSNESTPSIQLINPSIVNDGKTVVFLGVSNNCGKTSIEKEFRFANGQIIPVGNPVGIRLKKSITRKKSIGTKRKR